MAGTDDVLLRRQVEGLVQLGLTDQDAPVRVDVVHADREEELDGRLPDAVGEVVVGGTGWVGSNLMSYLRTTCFILGRKMS